MTDPRALIQRAQAQTQANRYAQVVGKIPMEQMDHSLLRNPSERQ